MLISLLLLQAASTAPPVIELNARVHTDSVTIEKHGDARLTVYAEPEAGKIVDVQAPKANGRKTLHNVEATVHAEANVAEPDEVSSANPAQVETPSPD